jgi:predicted permease
MLDSIGSLVTPLLLISLGLKMKFDMNFDVLLVWANLLRFGIGLFVSLMFVMVFGFSDLVEEVLIISSLAPIGYTSLLYADKENLDSNFASIQISVSIIFASIIIPFVIWYLN